jgi:IS1 family transposase
MRRLMRNRLSAHQARERKKQHVKEVESQNEELRQRWAVLADTVNQLEKENASLRSLLRTVSAR